PSDTFEGWQARYTQYAACLKHIKELSFDLAGLTLNSTKGALLLPAGAPLPTPAVQALFPARFEFRQDGFRDGFMEDFLKQKVLECRSKLTAVKALGKKSPRAGHRLLTACFS